MFSENYRQEIYQYFQKLVIPGEKEKIYSLIAEQEEDVRIGLEFLYASMPESDMADYEPELFLDYARHGVKLWEEQRWGTEIPEKIFANYVLHHRVNNEDLEMCRPFFYEQLEPMIRGKSMKEAVTLINYWCSAMATYRSTDGRTANAMTVFRSAYGRCGEESTFAVTALRSVGIPARQVYAPLWSHCDDNHAWVEVWIDGDWYFFGACEPDEIMNVGWFTNPSSRAMMVLSRWLGCDQPEEQVVGTKGAARIVNHLSRYAKTTEITVTVKDDFGNPVPGARIRCCVVNYGMFGEIATLEAGEDGTAKMETGLGSLFLSCRQDRCYGETLINTKSEKHTEIILTEQPFRFDQWDDFDMEAPEARPINADQPTEEQRTLCQERTEKCTIHRKERTEAFFSEEEAEKQYGIVLNRKRQNRLWQRQQEI